MSDVKTLTSDARRGAIEETVAFGVTGWIKAVLAYWKARQERRAAITALTNLDDRMLNDIGIARSQIATIMNEGVRRGGLRR